MALDEFGLSVYPLLVLVGLNFLSVTKIVLMKLFYSCLEPVIRLCKTAAKQNILFYPWPA